MTANASILEKFKDTHIDSRPLVRYWFPDAGADPAVLRQELTDLYNAGFGGVEIALVPRYAEFDAYEYGFGTRRWVALMKETLRTALSFERRFQVDFTGTPHWPVALNTIDPNDDSASMEVGHAFASVAQGAGTVDLPMPEKRLLDFMNAPFIFQDKFLAAVVARVAERRADGTVVLDDDTLTDVTARVRAKKNTTPAGVPDLGDAYVADLYRDVKMDLEGMRGGADTRGVPVTEDGIRHIFGNRKRLKNTQQHYEIDLSGLDFSGGEWLLFAFYRRGTGHAIGTDTKVVDGGKFTYPINTAMAEVPYVIDHFSHYGAREEQKFWEKNILSDPELVDLLRRNRGNFFEDSIETVAAGPFWSKDFPLHFKLARKYDVIPFLPLLIGVRHGVTSKITPYDATRFVSNRGTEVRCAEDYFLTLNDMYRDDYVQCMMEWTHAVFGGGYRAQCYHTQGITLDTGRLALSLDVAEGESLAWNTNYDRFRVIAGGVHVSGHRLFTDEVIADNHGASYRLTWPSATYTFNNNFATGVNCMILHGSSHAAETSGKHTLWPGWHPFGANVADSWSARMPYWENVTVLTDFLARLQAVLQNGKPGVDLAVFAPRTFERWTDDLRDKWGGSDGRDLSLLRSALDRGYSYDTVNEAVILHRNATVEGKTLCASGPAYRALVAHDVPSLPLEAARRIVAFARAGLPVVFVAPLPERLSGADAELSSAARAGDEDIQSLMRELTSQPNVAVVPDVDSVPAALEKFGILPFARYDAPYTRNVRRHDTDGSTYYYLFNNSADTVRCPLALTGEGHPHALNPWTGEIAQLAEYSRNGNVMETRLTLAPGECTVIALLPNAEDAPRIRKTSTAEITALDDWDIRVESWGSDDAPGALPTQSKKTAVEFTAVPLAPWANLPVTASQLKELGVTAMENVSGRAAYRTAFVAKEGWPSQGAHLLCRHGEDQIVWIKVNGTTLPGVDQSGAPIDIGRYMQSGDNTLEIGLSTPLNNRLRVEHPLFADRRPQPYGLLEASLAWYAPQKI